MKRNLLPFFILLLFFFAPVQRIFAYEVKDLSVLSKEEIALSPAKIELFLDPGDSAVRNIAVTNNQNKKASFKIEVEDFSGTHSPSEPVMLFGSEKGPYSLKDFLSPELYFFTLEPYQQITFRVDVVIPKNAEPGGLYGSVLVSSVPSDEAPSGSALTISRVGSLFFVRVKGAMAEKGELSSFSLKGSSVFFAKENPLRFDFLYRNTGSVHLSPYGLIRVRNTLGAAVDEFEIEPFFAMPDSERYRDISRNVPLSFGRYTAEILLNRGYGNIVDEKKVAFYVLPPVWIVISGSIFLLILASSIRRRKKKPRTSEEKNPPESPSSPAA